MSNGLKSFITADSFGWQNLFYSLPVSIIFFRGILNMGDTWTCPPVSQSVKLPQYFPFSNELHCFRGKSYFYTVFTIIYSILQCTHCTSMWQYAQNRAWTLSGLRYAVISGQLIPVGGGPHTNLRCFKFTGKFQQIDRRVAVQTVYGRFFSSAVFPVDGLQNSRRIQLLKLPEFSSPYTGKFQ